MLSSESANEGALSEDGASKELSPERAPEKISRKGRKIIHIDMDAFYAQIEQRDFPEKYAGAPIAVGGAPPRGVVQTASYEARPYGVHSAQPAAEAVRKCPDLIFVSPRMDVYKRESKTIRQVLHRYTDLVEPLSLDEAYLDVTEPKQGPPSATLIARRIRTEIWEETGLTASAGVGPSKFVAKVASDQDKPDGLTVVPPENQMGFIAGLQIEDVHGIGPVTAEKMRDLGIQTGADLQEASDRMLVQQFGKRGAHFKKLVMGRDDRMVEPNREPKSIGAEKTFRENLTDLREMLERLDSLAGRVARRLKQAGWQGRTLTLKIKDYEHEISSRQRTLERPIQEKEELLALADRLLRRPQGPMVPVRLLGLTVSSLTREKKPSAGVQLKLEFSS